MRGLVVMRMLNLWSALLLTGIVAGVGSGAPVVVGDDAVQVTIERTPFTVRPATSYDIPLRLQATKEVQLVALVDGVVLAYRVKPGEKAAAQTELMRLDGRAMQLEVDRAAAALEAAKQDREKGGAPARVDVAQKELEIVQLRLEQSVTRMPWDGVIYRIHVVEGQFVRAGDPLVTVADPARLFVEAPVDRTTAQPGQGVDLKVEEVTVQGELTAVMPLSDRLDPLRGLFESVASGRVELDNTGGRFLPGQTVYSPMIPRQPVGEAPTAAISNTEEGGRKVQVIRDGMIRDVAVELLGQVGENHVWVSGRFGTHDELVLRTSEPLVDGTLVTPRGLAEQGSRKTTPAATPANNTPRTTPSF
jgi:multidrug efflux pump subunit AcrA (membrane-fusion protein)